VILEEEQERGLHSPDWREQSAELGKTHVLVDGINGECDVEVR
jgi:hypothetical protein